MQRVIAFLSRGQWRAWLALLILGLLLGVYPIKGTVALRNLLLVMGFLVSWAGWRAWRLPALKLPAMLLALLTLWLVFQAAFISPYREMALSSLTGNWLRCVLCALLACQVHARLSRALNDPHKAAQWLATAALAGLAWHSIGLFLDQLMLYFRRGAFDFSYPFRDIWSDVNNAALALVVADLLSRWVGRSPLLVLPRSLSIALLSVFLADVVLLRTRNGALAALAMLGTGSLFLIARLPWKGRWIVVLCLAVGLAAALSDKRFYTLKETLPLAWDIDNHVPAWLDGKRELWPRTENGDVVEESVFLRVSWFHAALREVLDKPLGYGYSHRAYGYAINQRYGTTYDIQSSHNGWMDFALAAGVPGLMLWVAAELALMRMGIRNFRRGGDAASLALLLVVMDYFIRCLIDGHLAGARLEWFWLMAGLLAVSQTKRPATW